MRLQRTASRARNGIENSVEFKDTIFRIVQEGERFSLEVSAADVQEFGNPKTHYDYTVFVTLADLVSLIGVAAGSSGEAREHVRDEIGPHLGKLIKLVNLCAE